MNTEHIIMVREPSWEEILGLQEVLLKHYQTFDFESLPFSELDSGKEQTRLRSLLMRAVEEYSEYREAFSGSQKIEELADSVIFLIEICLLLGIKPEGLGVSAAEDLDIIPVLYPLKYLRNKPWKRTIVPADVERFKAELKNSIETYIATVRFHYPEIPKLIYKKMLVNKFRIETNY